MVYLKREAMAEVSERALNFAILTDWLAENDIDPDILDEALIVQVRETIRLMPSKKSVRGKRLRVKKSYRGKKS